jgi:predicted exporter
MAADFVPSPARQRENAALVRDRLVGPLLANFQAQLGLAPTPNVIAAETDLTLDRAMTAGAVPFLSDLVLDRGRHLVALDGLKGEAALRQAIARHDGVKFIDPAGDFTLLLGKYRERAVWLICLSAILMLIPLSWRYGLRGAILVMAPPASALILAPALIALSGHQISFFHVMALILVLSVGVDYAIFCAEIREGRQGSTLLGVGLATLTTLLSFGVLALSSVFAVHAFGLTLLLGVLTAFLLSPIAARATLRRRGRGVGR